MMEKKMIRVTKFQIFKWSVEAYFSSWPFKTWRCRFGWHDYHPSHLDGDTKCIVYECERKGGVCPSKYVRFARLTMSEVKHVMENTEKRKGIKEYLNNVNLTINLTAEHCICIMDQYGFVQNENCLIHGRRINHVR